MIIRSAVQCETCDIVITVRIGMGQGVRQEHTIDCRGCKEKLIFGMTVNYAEISTEVFSIEGCKVVETPQPGTGPVVNVDASFVVPENLAERDGVFHRLEQMDTVIRAAEKFGPLPIHKFNPTAPRRPTADNMSEWKQLKKAISLTSNGKLKLAERKLSSGSSDYYASDPLKGPSDWFFRFTMKTLGRSYSAKFTSIIEELKIIKDSFDCNPLLQHYESSMVDGRFRRYLEIYTDFYSKFSQFEQVYLLAGLGLPINDGMVATSVQFDAVKSFYGDCYEVFSGSVDLLALLNNVKQGRAFNEFETLTLQRYMELDNSSKFNAFSMNKPFSALCEEKDNQLRNASHHRGMKIDSDGRIIRHRAGKGGTGPESEISYAKYLHRSVSLFLQICVLASVELVICSGRNIKLPFDQG